MYRGAVHQSPVPARHGFTTPRCRAAGRVVKRDVRTTQVLANSNGSVPARPSGSTRGAVIDLDRDATAKPSTQVQSYPLEAISTNGAAASSNGASTNGASSNSARWEQSSSTDGSRQLKTAANLMLAKDKQASMDEPEESNVVGDRDAPYQVGFSPVQRTFQIYSFALRFAFKYWRLGKAGTYKNMEGGMSPENVSAKKRELAVWLREGLIKLGPTFIKIGQQFSTRVDVLSQEFIKELEQLQDNVPAFGAADVRETIESQLGKRVEEVFEEFDFQPIAAASLGQVHRASLRGKKVVVKVQRPQLRELFAVDLKNVRVIAQWLQRLDPKSDGAARDWVAIYDECSRILYEEINYRMEAQYAREFAENFKEISWVKVPAIDQEYLTEQVLVMEYVPGVKINDGNSIDAMGLDRDRLARLSVESYLQQLLRHGLFHADPHPGNVAVDAKGGGRLIYYDFGMMGRIPTSVRDGLRELFYGVYQQDADKCLDALAAMGVLVGSGDRTSIRRTADFFLKSFQQRLDEQRKEREENPESQESFKPQRSKEESRERRKAILANIGEDLLVAAADKPFRFPAEFTFVVRSFTVLDGIGKTLSPRFDISEISAPYARELVLDSKPQLDRLQENLTKNFSRQNRAVKGLFTAPLTIEDVRDMLKRIETGDTKPRVRALEVERALKRMQLGQTALTCLVAMSMFVNIGTVLSVSVMPLGSMLSFVAAGISAILSLVNFFKLKNMEKKELQITGAAA